MYCNLGTKQNRNDRGSSAGQDEVPHSHLTSLKENGSHEKDKTFSGFVSNVVKSSSIVRETSSASFSSPSHQQAASHVQAHYKQASAAAHTDLLADLQDVSLSGEKSPLIGSEEANIQVARHGSPLDRRFTTNTYISSITAAHAWEYMGILLVFAFVSFLSAIIPLLKYIPYKEIMETSTMSGMMRMPGMNDITDTVNMVGIIELTTGQREPGYINQAGVDVREPVPAGSRDTVHQILFSDIHNW